METQEVRFCVCDNPEPFFVDNVPARVCHQCGHKEFSDDAISALETIKNGTVRSNRTQVVRVFNYSHLLGDTTTVSLTYENIETASNQPPICEYA